MHLPSYTMFHFSLRNAALHAFGLFSCIFFSFSHGCQQKDAEANQNAVSILDAALCAQKEETAQSRLAEEKGVQQCKEAGAAALSRALLRTAVCNSMVVNDNHDRNSRSNSSSLGGHSGGIGSRAARARAWAHWCRLTKATPKRPVAVLTLVYRKTLRQRQVLSRAWQKLAVHSKTARVAMGYDGLRSIEQRRKRRWMHRRVVVLALRSALGRTFQKWLAMCTRSRRRVDGVQKWALLAARNERQALARRWRQWQRWCAREAALDAEAIRAASVRIAKAFGEWRLHCAIEERARKEALQAAFTRTSSAFTKWRLVCAQERAMEAEFAHTASARRVRVRPLRFDLFLTPC